jgi:2'-5' RNA ligase
VLGTIQTAVVVTVPEAEPVVAAHRARFDPAASWGVPAHVTVLYPFVAPATLDDVLVRRLADAVRTVPAFGCAFRRTRWFDQDVLWLAPEPHEPFVELIRVVWAAFPEHPPYGGEHEELMPHLTVGQCLRDGDLPELESIDPLVSRQLPVTTYVDRVHLLAGAPEPGGWRSVAQLELGAPA